MKKRDYKRFDKIDGQYTYKTIPIDSYDVFEDELEIIVADIEYLSDMGTLLAMLGYDNDTDYFYRQCREIISVPEKHINESGEGKFTFQTYFHNFPQSVESINKDALTVIVLHPLKRFHEGKREFNVVGYIHVNRFDVHWEGECFDGYYYNMLRIGEQIENGQKLYRRKKIFTLMFSIMHSIVDVDKNIAFAYGAMGKENQAINEALELNTKLYNKHYEKWAFKNNTLVNKAFGSGSAFRQCVDISDDTGKLREFYRLIRQQKSHYAFYHLHSEDDLLKMIRKIREYSESSRVYMVPDSAGNISAACMAMNWGDYFRLTLQNPRGLFKMVANMKLTDNLLYPFLVTGDPKAADTLLRGIAHKYAKQHNCYLTVLNAYDGDPYYQTKKSLLNDDYLFLIITNDIEKLHAMKEKSRGADGHVKLFIDNPLL